MNTSVIPYELVLTPCEVPADGLGLTVRTQGGPFSHFLMHRKDFYADAAAKAAVLPI